MTDSAFARHVREGLAASEKFLSSKYFYDQSGDRLFQAIMTSPEYYLTNAELEIFSQQKEAIRDALPHDIFDLVELGAGDGFKTQVLLEHFVARGTRFEYLPVDISDNALMGLKDKLQHSIPELIVKPVQGDYLDALNRLPSSGHPRVILFLGSNIGNFPPPRAVQFLRTIRNRMDQHDALLIGFDLKKHPKVILAAYNDAAGHTRSFNLNLLVRINRELGGQFDLDQFEHFPTYDPQTGATKSFLISQVDQQVPIAAIGETFSFRAGESIFMEISQKYSPADLDELAAATGFVIKQVFIDSRQYFADQLWLPESQS